MTASRSIRTPLDLGRIVRAVRKAQRLRQDDTAGSIGVSENFLAKVERGGERAQLGKVMQVLRELGIELIARFPSEVEVTLENRARARARSTASGRLIPSKGRPPVSHK